MENSKSKKSGTKKTNQLYDRLDLGIYNGIQFELVVPSKKNKETRKRYYIYYYIEKGEQYGKLIKQGYLDYVESIKDYPKTEKEKLEELRYLFRYTIETNILPTLNLKNDKVKISVNTFFESIIDLFEKYQVKRYNAREITTISTYKYKNGLLMQYFSLETNKNLQLKDVTKEHWTGFRDYYRDLELINSTINSLIVYANQLYKWLATDHGLKLYNPLSDLKTLDTSKQEKKYKVIDDVVLGELFQTLEDHKVEYTRVYLCLLLVYENLLRPVQICHIQYKNIDLRRRVISNIYNGKNRTYRKIEISDKAAELIQMIIDKTVSMDISLKSDMWLIGGYNIFKEGLPNTPQSIRQAFAIFQLVFPQFSHIKPYENKGTSITKQFEDSEMPVDEIRQRAGHSKLETTQIYNTDKTLTKPFKLKVS